MDSNTIRGMVETHLPEKYEPLLLSFVRGLESRLEGPLVAIGDDEGRILYCDVRDGHVLSVDDRKQLPTRFVNSSIPQLAPCLQEYEGVRATIVKVGDALPGSRAAEMLRSRFREIDAPALAVPEHWWSVVVEQVEAELL